MKATLDLFSKIAVFQPRDSNTVFWSHFNRPELIIIIIIIYSPVWSYICHFVVFTIFRASVIKYGGLSRGRIMFTLVMDNRTLIRIIIVNTALKHM